MSHAMHFPILSQLGLSENEALLYELLLESGAMKVRDLVKQTGIGRGYAYNVLMQLQQQGLVIAIEGKQTSYQAVDPSKLRLLLERRVQEAHRLEEAFTVTLPQMASAFNLSTGKPAIQMFEGLEGIRTVLDDSLQATGEILTIVDPEAVSDEMARIEARYIAKRVAKKIHKRVLMPDTAKAYGPLPDGAAEYTRMRVLPDFVGDFRTAVEIYDDRMSFITLAGTSIISLLINDKSMTALQRAQFEALWKYGREI